LNVYRSGKLDNRQEVTLRSGRFLSPKEKRWGFLFAVVNASAGYLVSNGSSAPAEEGRQLRCGQPQLGHRF
jgi:hypothetical protein